MAKRTTLVDRRILTLVVQGIPELPEGAIERHLKHAALLHEAEEALLRADLTKVDLGVLVRLLHPELSNEIRRFVPGTLDRVRALGGQFAQARMTTVPGGETLESQRQGKVIMFWTDWHFQPKGPARLTVASSIASQVVYLPDLVEDSLKCSFDKVEDGRLSVQEILDSLPKVEGLRWIIGNAPTVCRVLANHLNETGTHLLPRVYTIWTTDEYDLTGGLGRLIVGSLGSGGVDVRSLGPVYWHVFVGLFVLGVPS